MEQSTEPRIKIHQHIEITSPEEAEVMRQVGPDTDVNVELFPVETLEGAVALAALMQSYNHSDCAYNDSERVAPTPQQVGAYWYTLRESMIPVRVTTLKNTTEFYERVRSRFEAASESDEA